MIAPRHFTSESLDAAALLELVQRGQAGDLAAQSGLVRLYTRRLGGFVRSIVRGSDSTEDIVQLAFIKAMRRLPRLRNPAVFESWLFMLTRNTALDYLRRNRRRPQTVALDELVELPEPAPDHDAGDIHEAFTLALAQLSPIDRGLITQFVRGENYRDMATRAGLTLGAVKARLHRIRPFLRSAVGEAAA